MKTITLIIGLCMVLGHALSQTSQAAPDFSTLQWVSQSKTVEAYRQKYPQLTNMTDEHLVIAIGIKFPQTLKMDSVFSNEFSALNVVTPASEPDDQITTRSHEVYRGVKIMRVDPVGLTVSYTNSSKALLMQQLRFEDLSDALQQKYHYKPQAALDYQTRQQQGMIELRQRLEINDHIAQQSANKSADEGVQAYKDRQQQKLNEQLAQAQQKEAQAKQTAADAAMIEAMKPPPQINMQQNTYVW